MKEALFEVIDRLGGELTALSDDIFDHPEVGYEEYRASGLLCDLLEREGFAVERGIAGIPTAFRAVYENGVDGPSMGLLCEYDALEGIGHACGHHTQGPCAVGAALAVKETVKDQPYKLVIYGTPAEETVGGKIQMKERGCFQDIDVALMMHPSPTTTTDVKCMAMATYQVTFHGISAHAAMSPESGRSALDAVMLAAHGIECLREHVKEDTRLHYTIKDAGGPSNVVPAAAKAEFCMRSYNTDYLYGVMERVKKIIAGAAMMTETEYEIAEDPFFMAKIPDLTLNRILMENAALVEAPTIRPPREKTGSTDFGNVMYDVPGSCIRMAFVPERTSSHSREYLEAGKSQTAHRSVLLGAKILAASCLDMICDPGLLEQVKRDFKETKEQMGRENH